MHFLRNAMEQARIAVGQLERQVRQAHFVEGGAFDISSLPIPKGKEKAYPDPRNVAELNTIVVHVTGVRGGFGVSKRRVKHWENAPVPDGLLRQLGATTMYVSQS